MNKIDINSQGLFDLDCEFLGEELKQHVITCINAQKVAAQTEHSSFEPCHESLDKVSVDALQNILEKNIDIHGVATDSNISNVITFGAEHIKDSVNNDDVKQQRREVDKIIKDKLLELFTDSSDQFASQELDIVSSGHFWYPQHSFMSWHTNSQVPGWRIYINYAEAEGDSFFRYQEVETGKVITLHDKTWNLRVFRITDTSPLWHCVYSNTNRFSLGYMVKIRNKRQSFIQKVIKKLNF